MVNREKKKASSVITGPSGGAKLSDHTEKPLSKAYRVMDNDLARDNLENDIPAADLEDI